MMNKLVCEMAQVMLSQTELPLSFWVEAVHTAVYIISSFLLRRLLK